MPLTVSAYDAVSGAKSGSHVHVDSNWHFRNSSSQNRPEIPASQNSNKEKKQRRGDVLEPALTARWAGGRLRGLASASPTGGGTGPWERPAALVSGMQRRNQAPEAVPGYLSVRGRKVPSHANVQPWYEVLLPSPLEFRVHAVVGGGRLGHFTPCSLAGADAPAVQRGLRVRRSAEKAPSASGEKLRPARTSSPSAHPASPARLAHGPPVRESWSVRLDGLPRSTRQKQHWVGTSPLFIALKSFRTKPSAPCTVF